MIQKRNSQKWIVEESVNDQFKAVEVQSLSNNRLVFGFSAIDEREGNCKENWQGLEVS